jgi:hypothetical protein
MRLLRYNHYAHITRPNYYVRDSMFSRRVSGSILAISGKILKLILGYGTWELEDLGSGRFQE